VEAVPKKNLDSRMLPQAIQFSEQLADPQLWVRKAEELLAAAHLLETEIQAQWAEIEIEGGQIIRASGRTNVQGPYFVLIAYAIENLFKATLVHRNRESLRNRLLLSLPRYVSEHDLIKLARRVAFSISVPDEDLLTRLTRNSVWAGRYPVPTGPNGSRALEQYSDGRVYLTAFFAPKDVDRLHDLLNRIRSFALGELKETA
jgi:hypothetical protein